MAGETQKEATPIIKHPPPIPLNCSFRKIYFLKNPEKF